ncbi:MAG TPA: adenylate/guanylate cyclase domain-containing protein, partial [Myxococcales bacterium]|nr:adenylate/guanylate cyclase domain-containing protein [Myxococcales bacterium]
MNIRAMRRRIPLRVTIAGFAASLVVLATLLVAFVTVILPWRQKLKTQDRLATQLVKTALPLAIHLQSDGAHFDRDRVRALTSGRIEGVGIVYELFFDEKGHLDEDGSSVNAELLKQLAPDVAPEPKAVAERVAAKIPGLRRLPINLVTLNENAIGRIELGLSSRAIDAEARRTLRRDAMVLGAVLLFAILSAFFLAGRIAQPLVDLSFAMGRLRRGDFDARSPSIKRQDEVGDLARAFDEMAQGLRERERLKGTLGRYVSGDVADLILSEASDLALPGDLKQVTVLFLDVRGFTAISERLPPQEVMALLNAYFDVVVDRVAAHGGTLHKFMGDAALCVWGAPRELPEPERAAVNCALAIQAAAAQVSAERRARGLPFADLGIGINAGEVVAGNLGAAQRLEYTVIGDAVNIAQRIESHARGGEVLISESV